MPTQTFNNLAEEKRRRVFRAIYFELLRVPFPEISINRIIKNAEIPRGSFYQYFLNKDDAFEYFVDESVKRIKEKVIARISSVHGDIFELCENVFDEIISAGTDTKWLNIINHVVPYMNMNKLEPISEYIEHMNKEKRLEAYCSLGIGNLQIKDENELMDIIGVIESIFQSLLPQVFFEAENREKIREKFIRRLNIVKRAVIREEI